MAENSKKPELNPELNQKEKDAKHMQSLIRHISLVREACCLLGQRLIEKGEESTGRALIANGHSHDYSKFSGIEWTHLRVGMENEEPFKLALRQHWSCNPHHPEYWDSINDMSRVYIAEMVCDWYARSSEFGTDLRSFIKDKALDKYGIKAQGKCYKRIKEFVDLLLDDPFS